MYHHQHNLHQDIVKQQPRFPNGVQRPLPPPLQSRASEPVYFPKQAPAFGPQGQARPPSAPPSPGINMNKLLQQTANLIAMSAVGGVNNRSNNVANRMLHTASGELIKKEHNDGVPFIPPPLTSATIGGHNSLAGLQQNMTTAMQNMQNLEQFNAIGGSRNSLLSGKKSPKPDSYKTVMCQAWLESKICHFGENCRFAHGEQELRPCRIQPKSNNKYKTKLCDKYTTTGLCPYGTRCLFIHPDNGNNAYIRPDKVAEIAQKHADAARTNTNVVQDGYEASGITMGLPEQMPTLLSETPLRGMGLGARLGLRPHPSWPLEPAKFFEKEMMLQEILADIARATSPSDQPMDFRTQSPDPSELIGKELDYSTPNSRVSGYSSGGASPAGSSLFGSQSPHSADGSPYSITGGQHGDSSPYSCGSSAVSMNGDGFDMEPCEQSLYGGVGGFHLYKDHAAFKDVHNQSGQQQQTASAATDKTYDPFTFALGTDNLAREMCKHLDIW